MSRRILLLALLLAAPGCGRDAGGGASGGTLVIATPGDADVLLPPIVETQLGAHVSERIFSRLADVGLDVNTVGDSGFTPVLARRWERRDPTTLVFHLDDRARWHDGAPVTADDVVFTFDVYRDTLTGSQYRINLEPIASVTRQDASTVVFSFRRAYPEQLYDATYHLRILPRHLLDSIPRDRLKSSAFRLTPVGSGPFKFGHWLPGAELQVDANTEWFLGRPNLARIVWRPLPDVGTAVTALLAGEADAMEFIPQRDQIERVAADSNLRLMPYPSPFLGGLIFNLRRPPFDQREVRRALAMAIDRTTIVRSVFGDYGEVPLGSASRMQWIAREPVRQLAFDTAAAARLLDSLGWRRGAGGARRQGSRPLRFTVVTPTTSRIRAEVAVHLQSQLRALGVEVQIQPLEGAVFERRTRSGDFDAMLFSRTLDPSPANLVQFWGSASIGGDNVGGYRSASFDSLLARAAAASPAPAAQPLWRAVLELLNDDAPAVFIYTPRNNAAIHRRFEHVTIRPDSWLATVAAWSVAPDRRLPRDR